VKNHTDNYSSGGGEAGVCRLAFGERVSTHYLRPNKMIHANVIFRFKALSCCCHRGGLYFAKKE